MRIAHTLATLAALALTGCTLSSNSLPAAYSGAAIQGLVRGGQQPVVGGHVYLFAAGTGGYGTASTSLLNATSTGYSDSIGAYVPTGTGGAFSISGDYTCTAGTQVYLYVLGGNSGSGPNSAIALLSALGTCPAAGNFLASVPYLIVNEVTTVAAAYALAGFATGPASIASSGTALAQTGIANAFANARILASAATGLANTSSPGSNGVMPSAMIYTVANIIAACVNSANSPSQPSAGCTNLFLNALNGNTSPADTATAAINIAHNPGSNVYSLFNITTAQQPFGSGLSSTPSDFTVKIQFTGTGLTSPYALAIDASGNVWVSSSGMAKFLPSGNLAPGFPVTAGGNTNPGPFAIDTQGNVWGVNFSTQTVTEISNAGVAISPSGGYPVANISDPSGGVAIDTSGNIFVASFDNSTLVEISPLTGLETGFFTNILHEPLAMAADGLGNLWITNEFSTHSNFAKVAAKGSGLSEQLFTASQYNYPGAVAIDAASNAWTSNGSGITKTSNAGIVLSGTTGYSTSITGGYSLAIDGSGNVWAAGAGAIAELSNAGQVLSPPQGYVISSSGQIAADGSGNLWLLSANSLTELIGLSSPVVTPLAAGAANNTLGTEP